MPQFGASWRRERLPTPVFSPGEFHGLYSPWGLKELDTTELLSGEGNGTPFQYSCPENPMDREPGRLQSMRLLKVGHDLTFTFHFHALEKEMATHSSVLAWRILRMGEPGGLPSMGSHRVGHD